MGGGTYNGRWQQVRKYRALLGWPRRDPRRYRFPVPNEVWEYKLRPTEFVILSYLCCQWAHGREEKKICTQAVADSLHLTTATAEKYLTTLVSKGSSQRTVHSHSSVKPGVFSLCPMRFSCWPCRTPPFWSTHTSSTARTAALTSAIPAAAPSLEERGCR